MNEYPEWKTVYDRDYILPQPKFHHSMNAGDLVWHWNLHKEQPEVGMLLTDYTHKSYSNTQWTKELTDKERDEVIASQNLKVLFGDKVHLLHRERLFSRQVECKPRNIWDELIMFDDDSKPLKKFSRQPSQKLTWKTKKNSMVHNANSWVKQKKF